MLQLNSNIHLKKAIFLVGLLVDEIWCVSKGMGECLLFRGEGGMIPHLRISSLRNGAWKNR